MTLPWLVNASIRANLRFFSSEDKLEDMRLLEIRVEKPGVARENNIAAIDKVSRTYKYRDGSFTFQKNGEDS